jgi:hypothetical protein
MGRRHKREKSEAISVEASGLARLREDFASDKIDIDEFERRTMEILKDPDKGRRPPPPKPFDSRMARPGASYNYPTGATGPGYHDMYDYQRRRGFETEALLRMQSGLTTRNEERMILEGWGPNRRAGIEQFRRIDLSTSEASNKIKALYGIPENYLGPIQIRR